VVAGVDVGIGEMAGLQHRTARGDRHGELPEAAVADDAQVRRYVVRWRTVDGAGEIEVIDRVVVAVAGAAQTGGTAGQRLHFHGDARMAFVAVDLDVPRRTRGRADPGIDERSDDVRALRPGDPARAARCRRDGLVHHGVVDVDVVLNDIPGIGEVLRARIGQLGFAHHHAGAILVVAHAVG